MRLRKPCEHGRYDAHGEAYVTRAGGGTYRTYDCPGGEFLANDALVIEKVNGEWPERAITILELDVAALAECSGTEILDALNVRGPTPEAIAELDDYYADRGKYARRQSTE